MQTLAEAIAEAKLTPCSVLTVYCRQHGQLRAVVHGHITGRRHHCPKCSQAAWTYVHGYGGTRRELPVVRSEDDLDCLTGMTGYDKPGSLSNH